MRKILLILLSGVFLTAFLCFSWQTQTAEANSPLNLASENNLLNFRDGRVNEEDSRAKAAQLKDVQLFAENSGIAFTGDALFRTDDGGATWREIVLPRAAGETIGGVSFDGQNNGWAILADEQNVRLALAKTTDGGISWTRSQLVLRKEDLPEANLGKIELDFPDEHSGTLTLRLASSSNFIRQAIYQTADGGATWNFISADAKIKTSDDEGASLYKDYQNRVLWRLESAGSCEGFKTGCVVETKIFAGEKPNGGEPALAEMREITPPLVKELARAERQNAKLEAANSVFAQPPGGTTRISLNRGFDKCTAATAAQMQTWWNTSYFYDANIYISGRNRGCSQPQLTAAWVNTVAAQGWGLIPTIVGYQSPCTVSTTSAKFSTDPVVAEQQGRGEADIAIADANALGLTQGTVLYYDMERYDDLSGTGACSTPTKAFLKGWTDRVKELGYISGVYGSPTNAVGDWLNIPAQSRMDAVWLARWDNIPSVWTYAAPSPTVPTTAWGNHQRIKQWQAPHNETWGGVTFNIDGNIADGPVASNAIAKNKRADFDGDGKSDISVWRPETGVWYVWNSSNSSYTYMNFGLSTDILVPGDYDADGKTDFAVWRPSDGVWHIFSRSIYRAFAFGSPGDIPAAADYDGDGRTDAAVFRPSTGTWYVWNSFDSRGTSYTILQFGLDGDRPVTGDYDGDGKSDIAVYRPSDGVWYLLQSSAGFSAARFGISTDKPVPADYDGDGKTDIAVFRDGVWYLLQSQAGIKVVQFGLAGDKPAVGDYDGDGKADIAVYRPSDSVWYILQSQSGIFIAQFGISTDSPVPMAYTP